MSNDLIIVRDAKGNIIDLLAPSHIGRTRAELVEEAIAIAKDHRGSVDGIWPESEREEGSE